MTATNSLLRSNWRSGSDPPSPWRSVVLRTARSLARYQRTSSCQKFDTFVKFSADEDGLVENLKATGCTVVRLGEFPHPWDDQAPAVLPDLGAYGGRAAEHQSASGRGHMGKPLSIVPPQDEFLRSCARVINAIGIHT